MDSPIYITSPYFQTKTIQILLKHIAFVIITNLINNFMNITLGDWLKIINTMLHIYNFTTNTIYIITYFSTCWDNKLWIVEDHFHINLLLILYLFFSFFSFFLKYSQVTTLTCCRKNITRLIIFQIKCIIRNCELRQ